MVEKWEDWDLPDSVTINGNEYKFETDYRKILKVMEPLNDPDLLDEEKIYCAFCLFYIESGKIKPDDIQEAMQSMMLFINGNKDDTQKKQSKPLMDWEKDFSLIVAPINKAVGHDIRLDLMHWWTFLSYFMEIGECTFSTYVAIRNKKNKNAKLEKYEEEIYKNNIEAIKLKTKVDSTTQEMIDAILGKR